MSDAEELQRLVEFLSSLGKKGSVYAALLPVVERLRTEIREEGKSSEIKTANNADNNSDTKKAPLLFVALHKSMLAHGFICVVEMTSTVPGFAAPIRELPAGKLLPDRWDSDSNSFALLYKHKLKPGKIYCLNAVVLAAGSMLAVSVTERKGATYSVELDLADYDADALENGAGDETPTSATSAAGSGSGSEGTKSCAEVLTEKIRSLVVQLIPQIANVPASTSSSTATATAAASSSSSAPRNTIVQTLPSVSPVFDPYRPGSQAPPQISGRYPPSIPGPGPRYPFGSGGGIGVGGVGTGDLNPTFGGVPPAFQPPGSGSGSGSLVGPTNPIFTDGPSFGPGLGPGYLGAIPGLPQPRFDPYGPVTGPFGPDFGDVGVGPGGPYSPCDPRGPWPGRGVGPGRGRSDGGRGVGRGRRTPGEPNPDHLRPPGDDDDMFT